MKINDIDLTAEIDDIAHAVRRATVNAMPPKKTADEIINGFFERCRAILIAKNEEYSRDGDILHNFKIAAALQGISVRKALYGMKAKHVVSIADMCQGGDYSLEQWREKIFDDALYSVLLLVNIEMEVENESKNANCT